VIVFYTGNEGSIDLFWNNTGFAFTIASQFNAYVIFAEHRYYGESLPFGDSSFELDNGIPLLSPLLSSPLSALTHTSLTFPLKHLLTFLFLSIVGYLTVEQVLADYAYLIASIKSASPSLANSPVITLGTYLPSSHVFIFPLTFTSPYSFLT
jgi:lysosomal Pro-X carboxypeptidase